MNYFSTRDASLRISSAEAIVRGLSKDGGLFCPESIPKLTDEDRKYLVTASYKQRAAFVLGKFLTDFTKEELEEFSEKAYSSEKFDSDAVAPVHMLNEKLGILELWHGPTSAFKDMALQMLPHLLSAALKKTGEKRTASILVATSGDTGKAALEGFADVDGTKIAVFYPKDGVSKIQERQMTTQSGANVYVSSVVGNFDDVQSAMKEIFSDEEIRETASQNGCIFSSANSINWGRAVPQIAYYVSGYFDLAEISAIEHRPMHMEDYVKQLDLVLASGGRKLLDSAGTVSHKQAIDKAKGEYRKYQINELAPVEKEYLETVKDISKKAKHKK